MPNHGTRELYLIPLRPSDPLPEFTDLLDELSVPSNRPTSILLGVFIGDKKQLHAPLQNHPIPSIPSVPTPPPSAPALPNAKLQELMASLNPTALQSVLSRSKSPNPPPPPQQHQQQYPPYPPSGQTHSQAGQYPPQGYYPPPTNDYGYNQYQNQGYPGHSPHTQYGQGGNTPGWQNMPPPQNRDRDRQQGWDQRRDRRY